MSEDRQKAASFPAVSGFGECDAGGARETSDRAPSRETLRILIADDQDLVRSGFRMILSSYDGLSVEGEARNGEEAVYLAQKIRPDVALMDIRMPVRNGIDATRDITSNPLLSGTHVLVLTTFDIDEYVYDALAAGASGFLLKDAEPDDIVEAIHIVARGDAPHPALGHATLGGDVRGVAPSRGHVEGLARTGDHKVAHRPRARDSHAHRAGAYQ